MSFNASVITNDNSIRLEDDNLTTGLNKKIVELTAENECARQQIYSLENKLKISKDIQFELADNLELLEKSMSEAQIHTQQKIQDIEDK